ncbi:MAG: L-seryl-tRNA(Sec) selenium transferase [Betaproteobacteria bacterium ADurb.Bin341]|nr:MAG: L-seryl-tRNA(Sec) selenium transferase [Betaproteobacteria bacterium ADurb.Bin341]
MDKKELQARLRQLPSVDLVLSQAAIRQQIAQHGSDLVTFVVRSVIESARNAILNEVHQSPFSPTPLSQGERGDFSDLEEVVCQSEEAIRVIAQPLLKRVVNATGIIIHTNMGRAPLGRKVLQDLADVVLGYSNLEYDLEKAERGERSAHVVPLIKYLTNADDAVIVNNNAAGVMFALGTFAKGREVIVSRGELVEIGGSFRVPDIMAASGAIMVEVGTTNKTRLSDYKQAITANTAMILKVHRSNFEVVGFTEEVSVAELAAFSRQHRLPFLYDIGSGLIRKPKNLPLEKEPDVKSAIADGADLVAFSCDKLLGGCQAGIVAGRQEFIAKLKKAPMMRALRVDKLTLAVLSSVIRSYFNDATLLAHIPLFAMLEQSPEVLRDKAERLQQALQTHNVQAKVVDSIGRCGGGTLPMLELASFAVMLVSASKSQKERSQFAERVFMALHEAEPPVVGILRQGEMLFDVLTLSEEDIALVAGQIARVLGEQP